MIATVAKTTTLWRLSSSCICLYHYNGDRRLDRQYSVPRASVHRTPLCSARQLHPPCHPHRRPTESSRLVCMHCQRRRTIHNARRTSDRGDNDRTDGQTGDQRPHTQTQTREAHTSSRRLRGRHAAQTLCKLPTACPQMTCEPHVISRHNSERHIGFRRPPSFSFHVVVVVVVRLG